MVAVFNATRHELEQAVKTFGYTDREVKQFSMRDLRECIFANSDNDEPADWSEFRAEEL